MFVGPPFHAMPYARHVDYAASSIFINLTDTRKWFGKEKAQWHLNPKINDKHKGKDGEPSDAPATFPSSRPCHVPSFRLRTDAQPCTEASCHAGDCSHSCPVTFCRLFLLMLYLRSCVKVRSAGLQATTGTRSGGARTQTWGRAVTLKNMEQVCHARHRASSFP